MKLELEGKKVLITGASQGIGAMIAEVFAEEGSELCLVARNQAKLEELAQDLRERYRVQIHVHVADLTEHGAVDALAKAYSDTEILINNAGAIPGGDLWQIDEVRWRAGWELKVFGYINMTRAFYTLMKQAGKGVIINNIGSGGENLDFNYVAGCTGNAALMAFTKTIGGRSLHDGIRVMGVNPGPVATERIEKIMRARAQTQFGSEDQVDRIVERFPLKRPALPREVADMICFLASDRSGYTSGSIVTIDGGMASAGSIT